MGDLGSVPGLGRSPGEGPGNPLQYSCLENPMDREAWWATVHGIAKSRTRLSDFTHSQGKPRKQTVEFTSLDLLSDGTAIPTLPHWHVSDLVSQRLFPDSPCFILVHQVRKCIVLLSTSGPLHMLLPFIWNALFPPVCQSASTHL